MNDYLFLLLLDPILTNQKLSNEIPHLVYCHVDALKQTKHVSIEMVIGSKQLLTSEQFHWADLSCIEGSTGFKNCFNKG